MTIQELTKQLFRTQKYQPLNQVEISKVNLLHNYCYLSSIDLKARIAPVLKSNAYGHGLVIIAKLLDNVGAPYFCVDSLYEAYELLKAKIKTKILIMGYVDPENLQVKRLPFDYAVWDRQLLEAIGRYQPHAGIHIKVDTGMHRLGLLPHDLPDFLAAAKNCEVNVVGVMSHLASAEDLSTIQNNDQMAVFDRVVEMVRSAGFDPRWIHLQNSAGLLNHKNNQCTMARTGLALYGISPNDTPDQNLKPVLSLMTKLIQIKKLDVGALVGYGGTFAAKSPMTIGIIPMGYYDGIDRRLSNCGSVTIEGVNCSIVGRVSMNITAVDISTVKNPIVGQTVIVFSDRSEDKNSVVCAARLSNTIPYDLLVHISPTMKRLVNGG